MSGATTLNKPEINKIILSIIEDSKEIEGLTEPQIDLLTVSNVADVIMTEFTFLRNNITKGIHGKVETFEKHIWLERLGTFIFNPVKMEIIEKHKLKKLENGNIQEK